MNFSSLLENILPFVNFWCNCESSLILFSILLKETRDLAPIPFHLPLLVHGLYHPLIWSYSRVLFKKMRGNLSESVVSGMCVWGRRLGCLFIQKISTPPFHHTQIASRIWDTIFSSNLVLKT